MKPAWIIARGMKAGYFGASYALFPIDLACSTPDSPACTSSMPLKILRGHAAAPLEPLKSKTVAVLGYGNQGHAHALNLRDSGIRVVIGARRDGDAAQRAAADGFEPLSMDEATRQADLVIIALPDEVQPGVYAESIAPNLRQGATIGFIHGFNIRYDLIKPIPGAGVGVVMIAPKGPGAALRARYLDGLGLACLFASHQESARGDSQPLALAWANGIGCARAGIIFTTFADETDTDLFGEQTVLCGGMTWLILAAFETLVEAGYPPELAYLECCHEVKQIADLVYEGGIVSMMQHISNTAEFGAHIAGPKIVDESVRTRMREILHSIRDGSFARSLREDHARGFAWFEAEREKLRKHPIEGAGETVRALMPWLSKHR
jgi:ketol-acid reductoisomerase